MQDLRIRFGIILALAMLPLLVFSIWHSAIDLRQEREAKRSKLAVESRAVVVDIVDTVDNAKALLRTMDGTVDPGSCQSDLQAILDEFTRFDRIMVFDRQGQYQCTSASTLRGDFSEDLTLFTPESPFSVGKRSEQLGENSSTNWLRISYGRFENDQLTQIYTIEALASRITAMRDESRLSEGTYTAVVNQKGEILVQNAQIFDRLDTNWIKQAKTQLQYERRIEDATGRPFDSLILQTSEPEIFIAVATPARQIFSWSRLYTLSPMIIPILAWIFAFAAISWAADRLLISHLRTLRVAAIGFARGHYDLRLNKIKDAPEQIQELANTFDIMAERIQKRDSKLTESLKEKENLLREIHHRVKNNLQIIISLFNMQERRLQDPAAMRAITESRMRVDAIALVHKALYESEGLDVIQMDDFLKDLTRQLGRALIIDRKRIRIHVDVTCDPLEAYRATPIALFIVEAMTNAVKHGLINGGNIFISIVCEDNMATVKVRDDGIGAPDEDPEKGTGDKLMRGFARQLRGEFSKESSPEGYVAKIVFPLDLESGN